MPENMEAGKPNLSRFKTDQSILAVSAKIRPLLEEKALAFCAEIETGRQTPAHICRKAAETFFPVDPYRIVSVVKDNSPVKEMILSALSENPALEKPGQCSFVGTGEPPGKIAFVFPGQGSQYVNMGKELFTAIAPLNEILENVYSFDEENQDLCKRIYPAPEEIEKNGKDLEVSLRSTDVAQPAIGLVSIEMMKILSCFNVCAEAAAGHSFGELTALCAGNRIDETTFHRLAAARGRFMADAGGADKGKMLAVIAPLEKIEGLIRDHQIDAILANRNAPVQGVVSGTSDAVDKMKTLCRENRMKAIELPVSAAFHSRLVSEAALPFKKMLEDVEFKPGTLPVYSNTTGHPYPENEKEARSLLGEHLMNPVNFMEEIRNMHASGVRVFIEVGPKKTLTGLVSSILKDSDFFACAMDASQGKGSGIFDLALLLARLAALGYPVDIKKWHESAMHS